MAFEPQMFIFPEVTSKRAKPPLPPEYPSQFMATVHGTVFAERAEQLDELREGDELVLLPDPPILEDPGVWVHARDGDIVGHLPPEIERWLGPWMVRGGSVTARAVRVSGADVPSWRRLLIEVRCR